MNKALLGGLLMSSLWVLNFLTSQFQKVRTSPSESRSKPRFPYPETAHPVPGIPALLFPPSRSCHDFTGGLICTNFSWEKELPLFYLAELSKLVSLKTNIFVAWSIVWNKYMSGFLKIVLMSTQPPWNFSQKIHRFFLQSTTGSLSAHSLLTHLACMWLAGFRQLSLQGMSGQGCPAKKISTFT